MLLNVKSGFSKGEMSVLNVVSERYQHTLVYTFVSEPFPMEEEFQQAITRD
jgi:flavin reductase (DIM6/NTAB) family NADH-FMN oxidoreductase RutF